MKRLAAILLPIGLVVAGTVVWLLPEQPEAARPYEVDYAPQQPIAFSHRIHAGDNKIPCQYCHIYARRSIVSGVPPVALCMNCHKVINGTKNPQEVEKVRKHFQEGKPIAWVKVHDLPDFVYYSHKAHIRIGEEIGKLAANPALTDLAKEAFTCQNCHGPVEQMDAAELRAWDPELDEKPLTMGWCLTCHKRKKAAAAVVFKLKREAYARGVSWESLIGEARLADATGGAGIVVTPQDVTHTDQRLRDCWTCHK